MKTSEPDSLPGLGKKIEHAKPPAPAPVWHPVLGRPDFETDGSSIRKKELPPPLPTVYEFFGIAAP